MEVNLQTSPVNVQVTADPPSVTITGGVQGPPGTGSGGADFSWLLINSNIQMQAGIAYIVQADSLCSLTLPPTASRGDRLVVYRAGSANWRIIQGAGQRIQYGDRITTPGSGSMASIADGDFVFLVALSSTAWLVYGSQGHLEVN